MSPIPPMIWLSNCRVSVAASPGAVCQAMSRMHAARYSAVTKPWLKSRLFSIFPTSSAGMTSPV